MFKKIIDWLAGLFGGGSGTKPTPIPPAPPPEQPPQLNWPNRSIIGEIELAVAPSQSKPLVHGNRQWKLSGQDITPLTREALIKHIQFSVTNMQKYGAQIAIIWDIEGQEFFHPYSYAGSPDMLAEIAPEMEPLADEIFKIISNAGIKTGVCLRPDIAYLQNYIDGGVARTWLDHYYANDLNHASQILIDKISYCKKRWGCRAFYIDSNVWPGNNFSGKKIDPATGGGVMPVEVFIRVVKAHPDCLIIPEFEEGDYWKISAPYSDDNFRPTLGGEIKNKYPNAFQCLSVYSNKWTQEQLNACVAGGNIIMFESWWENPVNEMIKKAYDES